MAVGASAGEREMISSSSVLSPSARRHNAGELSSKGNEWPDGSSAWCCGSARFPLAASPTSTASSSPLSSSSSAAAAAAFCFCAGTKVRSKEMVVAMSCVCLIAVSYAALVCAPGSFDGSYALPPQIRTFLGMDRTPVPADSSTHRPPLPLPLPPASAPAAAATPRTNRNDVPQSSSNSSTPRQPTSVEDVLARAAMPDRTVILTTLNAAWAENNSMVDIFLEAFLHGQGTLPLLRHLIIVCVDQKAFERCQRLHPHCLQIRTGGVDFSGEQALLSHDYIKLIWRRIKFLIAVLELQYNFVFTDTDILWLRDPLPLLRREKADLVIACDRYNGRPWDVRNSPNAGFTYVRADNATVNFYRYWYKQRKRNPLWADQEVLNAIKAEAVKSIGVRMRFLDTQFLGGFCGIRFTDMSKAFTMHATCCKGLAPKLSDLRRILEGWKEYNERLLSLSLAPSPPPAGSPPGLAGTLPPTSFKAPIACPKTWRRTPAKRKPQP